MGTPIKSLMLLNKFSTKILSPTCSPKLLSPSLSKNINNFLREPIRGSNVAKRLDFSKTAVTSRINEKIETNDGTIKIRISDFDENNYDNKKINEDIFMNTPNKTELLRHGNLKNNILDVLGRGTFGIVFIGKHKEKLTAVKVIKNKVENGSLREKNALNLQNKHVIRTIEIIESAKENFTLILMEYYSNSKNLQTILDDSEIKLKNEMMVKFAIDVTKGLLYCHENGVLHLDIKPKNVLVCDNVCKICDFGNSVKISQAEHSFKNQGTLIYTAPELLLGEIPTTKSDVYSLGILLWQLKYRELPYSDFTNVETVIYKVIKTNLRPKEHVNCEENDEYSNLYRSCWDKEVVKRPEVSQVLNVLDNLF